MNTIQGWEKPSFPGYRSFIRHPIVWTLCLEFVLLVGFGVIGYYDLGNLRTPVALAVRYLFSPLLGFGLLLWIIATFAGAAKCARLRVLACICVISPLVAVRAYYVDSIYLVLYYEALSSVTFMALAFVAVWGAWRTGSSGVESVLADGRAVVHLSSSLIFVGSRVQNTAALLLIALMMIFLSWQEREPFLPDLQRQKVEGAITLLKAHERSGRLPTRGRAGQRPCGLGTHEYGVWVDGQYFGATRDVFLQLQKRDYIRAEVGSCSRMILSLENVRR